VDGETARGELTKIMNDKTHPDHEAYWRGDPKAHEKVNELYKKAFGEAKVQIGGVTVSGRTS
jgi:hypothetical protein